MTEMIVKIEPKSCIAAQPHALEAVAEYPGLRRPRAAPAPGYDRRFHDLLGPVAWVSLPLAVRHRFSRPLAPGGMRLFKGRVAETSLSPAGRILATLARLVGGPLPDTDAATGPATVLVTDGPTIGGQIWTRTYTRPHGVPQTINSVKRFSGPTGLEEDLGYGLRMRLTLHVEHGALVFRSAGFALAIGSLCLTLPIWLTPGRCCITHRDEGHGHFSFTLEFTHPWLGRLAHQVAHFEEVL